MSFPLVFGADALGAGESAVAAESEPVPAVSSPGSWNSLGSIFAAARADAEAARRTPPVACPNDGEPLIRGRDGRLFCRFDGWRP